MKVEVQEDHSLTLEVRCQQDKAITLHKLKGIGLGQQRDPSEANFARWLQTHTFSPANVASNGLGLFESGSSGQTHVQSSQVDSNQCSILTFTAGSIILLIGIAQEA